MFDFLKSSYQKVKGALKKTRGILSQRVRALFGKPWDDATFYTLEQILFEADLGSTCTTSLVEHLKKELCLHPTNDIETILGLLRTYALSLLPTPSNDQTQPPIKVILIVGVNGSGKTTSVAKLAHLLTSQGKKVLLAAGDTFRAAATDQLSLWAERLGIDIIRGKPGSDPAAIVFDALTAAKSRGVDTVLIDTAGRLQNKTDLMHELKKVRSVCSKVIPDAPHETLLVLDATTGQNALDQATAFHNFTPLSGIILAKLDGSSKGGIVLPIYQMTKIPVVFIGTGEKIEDLEPFDPISYVNILFESGGEG